MRESIGICLGSCGIFRLTIFYRYSDKIRRAANWESRTHASLRRNFIWCRGTSCSITRHCITFKTGPFASSWRVHRIFAAVRRDGIGRRHPGMRRFYQLQRQRDWNLRQNDLRASVLEWLCEEVLGSGCEMEFWSRAFFTRKSGRASSSAIRSSSILTWNNIMRRNLR